MGLLGVISGSIIMERSDLATNSKTRLMKNEYGQASVLLSDKIALILRHGNNPHRHVLPHMINNAANLRALKDLGVTEVVGINSTGSLKKYLHPGMIVIPDDFIALTATPTIHKTSTVHITPALNEAVRRNLIKAAKNSKISVIEKGTYWQTPGPRLETKAEIKMMSSFADVVGMTMANEAVAALELDIPYASACSIDNYGNGMTARPLSMEKIIAGIRKNTDLIIRLLKNYIELSPKK